LKKVLLIGMMVVLVGLIVLGMVFVSGKRPAVVSQDGLIYNHAISLIEKNKPDEAVGRLKELVEKFPDSEYVDEALINMGDLYLKEKDVRLPQAKLCYEKVVFDYPNSNSIKLAQEKLWDIKIKILFSPIETSDSLVYKVCPGDSLGSIAKKFNTTPELIMKSNGLQSDLIRPGRGLKVSKATYSLIVDKSRNTLTLKSDEEVLKVYKVSTGSPKSPTLCGRFIVESKLVDPHWSNIPPGDPRNVLGSRWMGFAEPFRDYGIHGTTEPETIGKNITKGCIRMLDDEVKEVFSIIPIGTEVIIVE